MAEATPRRGGPKTRPVAVRILDKVEPEPNSGCWLWAASSTRDGYGRIHVGSRTNGTNRTAMAHRVSFLCFVGEIPGGMCVCHRCDVPACVNPDHLFLGTPADNLRDKVSKGRQARGEAHGRTRFTDADIRNMRSMYAAGATQRAIAERYGSGQSYIWCVLHNRYRTASGRAEQRGGEK